MLSTRAAHQHTQAHNMTRGRSPPAGGKSRSCHLEDAAQWDVAVAAVHIWPVGAQLDHQKFPFKVIRSDSLEIFRGLL